MTAFGLFVAHVSDLVPQLEIDPGLLALGAGSPTHQGRPQT